MGAVVRPMTDYQGIAMIITSGAAAFVSIGTFMMQLYTAKASRRRDATLAEVHKLVNGQTEALKKTLGDAAFSEGKAAGILTERADPHTNAKAVKPKPRKPRP